MNFFDDDYCEYNDMEQQEMLQDINSFLSDCLHQTEQKGPEGASPASMTDEQLSRSGRICDFWKSSSTTYPGLSEVFACLEDLASQKILDADQSKLIRAIIEFPEVHETRNVIKKANLWVLRVEEEIHYRTESRSLFSDDDLLDITGGTC